MWYDELQPGYPWWRSGMATSSVTAEAFVQLTIRVLFAAGPLPVLPAHTASRMARW